MLKCKQSFPNNLNESLKASDIEDVNWDNKSCCSDNCFDSQSIL